MSTTVYQPGIASSVSSEPIWGMALQCPKCGGLFDSVGRMGAERQCRLRCSGCFFVLRTENGIWKALPPDREAYFQRFMTEYQFVRANEGRGSTNPKYYLALPHRDLSGHNESQWTIRSRTFRYVENKILPALESQGRFPMQVLDLGAGNGWMSYRLVLRGHRPVAVDLLTNDQDGLGAAVHFREHLPVLFPRFQAELDRLPFGDSQFHVAIFNASLHYSEDYERTLRETIRCLRVKGIIIVADTAWYRRDESGKEMLAERRQSYISQHGFASDSIDSLEYLTDERLRTLERRLGLHWQIHSPFYGVRWAMRPLVASLRRGRKPSRFRIYVAEVRK
jgi:SAM-dependent methyltransferase